MSNPSQADSSNTPIDEVDSSLSGAAPQEDREESDTPAESDPDSRSNTPTKSHDEQGPESHLVQETESQQETESLPDDESKSEANSEQTAEPDSTLITYTTGEQEAELDTVLRVPRSESSLTAPEDQADNTDAENTPAEDDISPSEVRYRLFPREHGLPPDAPLPETSGLSLGHFRIEERIGTGGMGAVFRAIDERLQRVVALKVLSPTQLHQPDAIQRFRNEARSAARLDHENIARVFYFAEEKGVHFIVGEFVTGANVRELIHREGRLKPEDAVYFTHQIASALNHTSAAGVIHRDIKPSNIIITTNGLAKLVDLGLARKESNDSADELTVAGTTLGTFDYLAPEQARDPRGVDVRSDIYSLGCSLYHMLTGEPPYPGGTVAQKLHNHQAGDVPDPAAKVPNLPPLLSQVVKKMMASDPVDRYRTPNELLADLEDVAHQLGMPGSHGRVIRRAAPISPRRAQLESYLGWIGMAILLMVLVMIIEVLSQSPITSPPPNVSVRENVRPPSPNKVLFKDSNRDDSPATNTLETTPSNSRPDQVNADGRASSSNTPIVNTQNTKPAETNLNPPASSLPLGQSGSNEPSFILQGENHDYNRSFATLSEACDAAPQNGVIEIQGDFIQPILIDQPFQLLNKSIRLRPVAGMRPRLQFQFDATRPSRYHGMIDLQNGSSLGLYNLDLEFQIDPLVEEEIPTLFALIDEGNSLSLNGCRVSIINGPDQLASFTRLTKATRLEKTIPTPTASLADDETRIQITRSFIHGNARLCQLNVSMPCTLGMTESVVACNQPTFYLDSRVNGGISPLELPISTEQSHAVELNVTRSTLACGDAFLYLDRTLNDSEAIPFLRINTSDNVFVAKPAGQTFVKTNFTEGPSSISLINPTPTRMKWKDNQGPDYLSRFRIYYANDNGNPEPLPPVADINSWRQLWANANDRELTSREAPIELTGVENANSLAEVKLQDFVLKADDAEVSPVHGGSDGNDAGAPISELIKLMNASGRQESSPDGSINIKADAPTS